MGEGIGTGQVKEGWYEDPADRHEYRWFSDGKPTSLVKDGAVTSRDSISITEPAAFESMELERPPDSAPLKQSGSAAYPDARYMGAGLTLAPGRRWRRRGNWFWWALGGMVPVLGLGSAYLLWTHSSAVPAGPASYLFAARGSLIFVEWRQPASSGAISGSITFAYLAGRPPAESLEVVSNRFTGELLGYTVAEIPEISLRVDDLYLNNLLSGSFQGRKLLLDVPSESGIGSSSYVLVRSDDGAYAAALRALTARNRHADQVAAARR